MRKVIIFSHSFIRRDPRLIRQIRWLHELGFEEIVTVGQGPLPDGVSDHHQIKRPGTFERYLGYLIRINRLRFWYFFGRHLDKTPAQFLDDVSMILINEVEYLSWSGFSGEKLNSKPVYLDLHEDHVSDAHRGLLEAVAFRSYWKWQLKQLVNFTKTRARIALTCVENEIAKSYEFVTGKTVHLIYNAPDKNNLAPTLTDPERVKLIHHGMGTKGRGIETTIRALSMLPSKYSLDLVLFSTAIFSIKIKLLARLLQVDRRVSIERGVPLADLPERLNGADISVVLIPNVTGGHLNSLPNKFFESIHAKLAIITGPNPTMSALTKQYGFGIVLGSWKSADLAREIQKLSQLDISEMKKNAVQASHELSSEQNGRKFKEIITELLQG